LASCVIIDLSTIKNKPTRFSVKGLIMQQFLTILAFYRPFVLWSFVANITILIVYPFIMPAVITKILLAIFVWYLVTETNARRRLKFCRKLGISAFKLFTVIFLFDMAITIGFLIVIKEFI